MKKVADWFKKAGTIIARVLKISKRDPWGKCHDSYYVYHFRTVLDSIAKKISLQEGSPPVYTRFNPHLRAAELHSRDGVLARVKMRGSEGVPYEAVVASNLPKASRALFRESFPEQITVVFKAMS